MGEAVKRAHLLPWQVQPKATAVQIARMADYLLHLRAECTTKVMIEKTPRTCWYFEELHEQLPADTRFVCMYRDPRDVTVSLWEQTWANAWPLEKCCEWWLRSTDCLRHDFVIGIRYESFVEDVEREGRQVLELLGIPDDISVFSDVKSGRVGRWPTEMPADLAEEIVDRLGDRMSELGYS